MIVLKFGGTSVSSLENIQRIASILKKKQDQYIVVVSAFSGITNTLEILADQALNGDTEPLLNQFKDRHFEAIKAYLPVAHQSEMVMLVQRKLNELEAVCNGINLLKELSPRTRAYILSFGEQLSSAIVQKYLSTNDIDITLLDSRNLIVANGDHLNADVNIERTNKNIVAAVQQENYIAGGFIGKNESDEPIVLGRGGSDYTASIFAAALDADLLEIWSDIDGIHRANPKLVSDTKSISKLSYEEAFELAYFGAKVLYPPSVIPVMNKKIPLHLKNTIHPDQEGSIISSDSGRTENVIQGLSSLDNIAILTVSGVGLAKQKGVARRVFQTLEEKDINIILITQSCSEQNIGIGIGQEDLDIAENALNTAFEKEIEKKVINPVKVIKDQCIVAIVGDNMKQKVGLCGKIFGAIGENGINVTAIAQGASERNISIVIDQADEAKALNVIHENFFGNVVKDVHLFIAGAGNVGSEFLKIVAAQKEKLVAEHQINLKIVGIANSRHHLINVDDGLSPRDLTNINKIGEKHSKFSEFADKVQLLNLRNRIFVDNTASADVASTYASFLSNNISVVTCNKIACSSDYYKYAELKKIAKNHNCQFKYETSVGAALPIIKTIEDLLMSGDKIHKIEAVISGSLNYIFNEYSGQRLFSDVVKEAKNEGYTEPNPLIDLSGLDVMRKILILSREAGYVRELSDIEFQSFLPEACANADSNDTLFEELKNNEARFNTLYKNANEKGNKLKVVAILNDGNLSVSLKEIPGQSPFYNLEGKDNVVAINTNRYATEPLVIKGAGAGSSVTASGVFADLMFIINR